MAAPGRRQGLAARTMNADPPDSFFVDLTLAPGITANLNEEGTMPLTTDQKFLLEEYKSLRDEIKTKLSENVLIQRQAVISTSIVYAIAATLEVQKIVPSVKPIAWIIWWIPVFITAFAYIFTLVNAYTIIFIATYIKQNIEPKFLSPPGGWEDFFGSQPRRWWLKLYPGISKNTPSARPANQIQRISLNLTTGSGCDGAIGFL